MRLRKRIKSNRGAAVTILSIALLILFLLISVFMVDFVKNQQLRNDYFQVGQRSTQAALIKQNGVGGLLGNDSANALIDEYMAETRGVNNPNQTIDSAAFRNNACAVDKSKGYPRIKVMYDTGRHTIDEVKRRANAGEIPSATSVNGNAITTLSDVQFAERKYKTITVQFTDVADNFFFGMFGMPCQEFTITTSSVATKADDFENPNVEDE